MTNEEILIKVFTPEQLMRMEAVGEVERTLVYNSVIVGYKAGLRDAVLNKVEVNP